MHLSLQWGATALVKAIEAGKVERVKLLLDAGVQVNAKNEVSAVLIKLQVRKLYLGDAHKLYNRCAKGEIQNLLLSHFVPSLKVA